MKKAIIFLFAFSPGVAFSQNEVAPDGYKLLFILLLLIAGPVLFYFSGRIVRKGFRQKSTISFWKKNLKVTLSKNKKYKPTNLFLKIENVGKRDRDIQAPILYFRKLWSKRKFRLKGVNQQEIYPLYLEKGKVHELQVDLSIFYQHDRKLKKFYWAKISFADTNGRTYSTKYVTLRKSLFS